MESDSTLLKQLLDEYGLEDLLLEQGISPYEALVALYNCGEFDLERLLDSTNPEEEDEYSTDD